MQLNINKDYNKLLGELINFGKTRKVYEFLENKKYVIKVQIKHDDCKHNLREWIIYKKCKKYKYLFVPCIEISNCSKYLVMLKGNKINKKSEIPKDKPKWLTDSSKLKQWVKIDGKIMFVDYAHPAIFKKLFGTEDPYDIYKEMSK